MKSKIISIFLLLTNLSYCQIPQGFKPIFNGKNLKGWHISRTTHQGTTPNFFVKDGAIIGKEQPYGQGGLLLTDKKYKSFELYLEVKLDSMCNSGIFLRSNEGGAAYQVELVLPGHTGDLLGERLNPSIGTSANGYEKIWKPGDWNSFRILMKGEIPYLKLWINGTEMWQVQQPKNDFIGGETEGMIALQCHWTALYSKNAGNGMPLTSWRPNAEIKFRNLAIKKL